LGASVIGTSLEKRLWGKRRPLDRQIRGAVYKNILLVMKTVDTVYGNSQTVNIKVEYMLTG
jgi:hypothetical protein